MRVSVKIVGMPKTFSVPKIIDSWEKELKPFFKDKMYDTRGSILGKKWGRRKKSYPWAPLQKTGRMRSNTKSKKGNNFVEISNPTSYAKYHQFGTKKMVARPIVGSNPELEKKLADIAKKIISKSAKGN